MNSLDLFLIQYGLAAIFIILLIKTIGIPVPIPADLIILTAAARVAQGKLNVWQTFIAIFIALVVGGLIDRHLESVAFRGERRELGSRGFCGRGRGRYAGCCRPSIYRFRKRH